MSYNPKNQKPLISQSPIYSNTLPEGKRTNNKFLLALLSAALFVFFICACSSGSLSAFIYNDNDPDKLITVTPPELLDSKKIVNSTYLGVKGTIETTKTTEGTDGAYIFTFVDSPGLAVYCPKNDGYMNSKDCKELINSTDEVFMGKIYDNKADIDLAYEFGVENVNDTDIIKFDITSLGQEPTPDTFVRTKRLFVIQDWKYEQDQNRDLYLFTGFCSGLFILMGFGTLLMLIINLNKKS